MTIWLELFITTGHFIRLLCVDEDKVIGLKPALVGLGSYCTKPALE